MNQEFTHRQRRRRPSDARSARESVRHRRQTGNHPAVDPPDQPELGQEQAARIPLGQGASTLRTGIPNAKMDAEFPRLLQAAQTGDEQAFARLMSFYQRWSMQTAQQILHSEDTAADAVQDAMIKIHRSLNTFRNGNFRSWVLRIVTNTCYDHLRRLRGHQVFSLDELPEEHEKGLCFGLKPVKEVENPEKLAIQSECMQHLLAAIDELPVSHRNAVLLIDVHGYEYEEAACELGIPIGTIKSRLSRGRTTLRERLSKDGWSPTASPLAPKVLELTKPSAIAPMPETPVCGKQPQPQG